MGATGIGGKYEGQNLAYEFLLDHANRSAAFTERDLARATGWKLSTVRAHLGKQLREVVLAAGRGRLRVRGDFVAVPRREFLEHMTQVRSLFTEYRRAVHHEVVIYEFLLPLTREDKLRKSLDDLFYRDRIKARLAAVDVPEIESFLKRNDGETDEALRARAVDEVGRAFGGYSISHVQDRFRAADLAAEGQTGQFAGLPYLVDETTAVVRFIVPCPSTRREHGERFILERVSERCDPEELASDLRRIRGLYFNLFVEALVPTIRGETEIWVVELAPDGRRVFALERMGEEPSAGRKRKHSRGKRAAAARRATRRSASAAPAPARGKKNSPGLTDRAGSLRAWLRSNGYGRVAALIDEVEAEWKRSKASTRRNWWDVLAGGEDGRPSVVAGRKFPVLRAAQLRQGRKPTPNAVSRRGERPPTSSRGPGG